ncbi:hypothetical protein DVW05_10670 [Clostridium botulinum]|uniref:hypothetical protein n=1 Tax=Clostridium sp. ZBS18 TaxID=2949967 RepID=UPI001D2D17D9|nr:hypothetical protein [Clostridium sp. ZBS18]MBN1055805.1 hypothetical protein [Clostridium botulinum]
MRKQYNDNYSRIPNRLFYMKNEDEEREEEIEYIKKGTIMEVVEDNKVILILHELYLGSDFRFKCYRTIDSLLEDIGYKLDKDNRKAIKNILLKLREMGYINFEGTETSIKSTTLLRIDVKNLKDNTKNNFVELAQCEIDKIMSLECDQRTKMGMLKFYLYIKARVYKREKTNDDTYLDRNSNAKAEATWQSFYFIHKWTNIKEEQASKYVDMLVELDMITVYKGKYKFKEKNNDLWKDLSSIYVINDLQASVEDIKEEIKLCVKQYIYILNRKGCIVTPI